MSGFAAFILICHYTLVGILCLYGVHRIYHTALARWHLNKTSASVKDHGAFFPKVTVQAPIFNEKFVAVRSIEALIALDYPKDLLQIQIINDSNDGSAAEISSLIRSYQDQGYDISHIFRDNRQGYKAGALAAAMDRVTGEFIAIFDADFIPRPDFLLRSLPWFQDENIGVVQSRWSFLNRRSNLLTRVQAMMLDAHFAIEQFARAKSGAMFNFNGTAGIWRKTTIEDAGGWRADSLTEDIDLSYRAQMRGWKFVYLKALDSPSEIPTDMCAFKVQQHRWAKGAIQVMKKLLRDIWKSPVSLHAKIEASFHLTANICYLLMFVDSVFFLLPSVHIRQTIDAGFLVWLDIPLFALASLSHGWFFLYGQKLMHGKLWDKLALMPVLLATSIGLGINNGRAVLEALFGHDSAFERTPKIGEVLAGADLETGKAAAFDTRQARKAIPDPARLATHYKALSSQASDSVEIGLAVFYGLNMIWAVLQGYWIVVPFLTLFSIGFLFTGGQSFWTRYQRRPGRVPARGTMNAAPISGTLENGREGEKATSPSKPAKVIA